MQLGPAPRASMRRPWSIRVRGPRTLPTVLAVLLLGALVPGSSPARAHDPWAASISLESRTSGATPRPAGPSGLAVVQTLDLATNRTFSGGTQPPIQYGPEVAMFDPVNGLLYVRGDDGETVSVVNTTTDTDVSSFNAPADQITYASLPTMAVDPVNGHLVLVNFNGGNVTILNATTDLTIGSVPVDNGPYGIVFDNRSGNFYVSGFTGDNVTVFSGTTGRTVANISVGSGPTAMLYDPLDNEVFVVNYRGDSVSVLNTTLQSVAVTVPVGNYPSDLALDPHDDYVDVAASNGGGQSNVSILNGANNTLVTVVGVGGDASALAFAPNSDRVFVVNAASDNVSEIAQPSDKVVKTVPIGHGSNNLAYDAVSGDLYSANYGTFNVSILNGTTGKVVGAPYVSNYPYWTAIDSRNGIAYDVNGGTGTLDANLTLFQGGVVATPVGSIRLTVHPTALVYDSATSTVLYADYGGDDLAGADLGASPDLASAPTGTEPTAAAYDSITGDTYVLDHGSDNLTVIGPAWTPVGTITLGDDPTDVAFDPGNGYLYVTDAYGGNVTVVDGATRSIAAVVTVKPYDDLAAVIYDPQSGLVYLADGTGHNVTVLDPSTDTLGASIPVGGLPIAFAVDPLNGTLFVSHSGASNITVVNVSTGTIVASVPVYNSGMVSYDPSRNLIVNAGTYDPDAWAFNASTYASVGGQITLGGPGYPSGIVYDPSIQATVVATEYDDTLSVLGTPVTTFPVTFEETGLPLGQTWGVVLNGSPNGSTGSSVGFRIGNGTWSFSVDAVAGYTANLTGGDLVVDGSPVVRTIDFSANSALGDADFGESGLPQGTNWNVTFDGTTRWATEPTIVFAETNGSYAFAVPDVAGYSPSPSAGHVTIVADSTVDQSVRFSTGTAPGPLVVTLTADPSKVAVRESTNFTTSVTGGSAPYSYVYTGLPAGCSSQNASRLECTPTSSGPYFVNVTVTDATGATARNGTTLVVSPAGGPPASGTPPSSPGLTVQPWEWLLLLLLVIVAMVAGLLAYRRRRKSRPPLPPGPPPAGTAAGATVPPPPPL